MRDAFPKETVEQIIRETYGGDSNAFRRDLDDYMQTAQPVPKAQPQPTGPVIIELKNVSREYKMSRKNHVQAVRNVDLTVHEGEIVALTGPSGSGKSTLMHLIGGLDRPTEGEVIVGGQPVGTLPERKLAAYRNSTVGIVFQFFYLQPFLKVDRNVEVPLMFARTKRKTRREPVQSVIGSVDMSDRAAFLPKELSGGQMQRAAIARALVNQPKILLADEPTGNLDRKNGDAIMQLLQTIRGAHGTTMIVITHDPHIASWADRIVQLEDGSVAV